MSVLENIEEAIKKKGITEYKVIKDTGLSSQFFQNWKKGSNPSYDKIQKIIIYLGLSADDILETGYNVNKQDHLTDNEKEMLEAFRRLPDREQVKEIGRMEDRASKYLPEDGKYINDAG